MASSPGTQLPAAGPEHSVSEGTKKGPRDGGLVGGAVGAVQLVSDIGIGIQVVGSYLRLDTTP